MAGDLSVFPRNDSPADLDDEWAMKTKLLGSSVALAAMMWCGPAQAQRVELGNRSIPEAAAHLKAGEYVWAAEGSSEAPALVIVNLKTQKLVLFRNGVPIGASTVSSGSPGHETPTGVFTILQKRKEHYSSTYNNAPMPNMQRLTQRGIALHAGKLPGYPASHGCIRLPHKFSELLFGATSLGMTVVITDIPAVPLKSGTPAMIVADAGPAQMLSKAAYEWYPERSRGGEGVVSVVVSTADQRALGMRDGVEIGSSPVRVAGATDAAMAYVLRAWDSSGQDWLKLQFSGSGQGMAVGAEEGKRFDMPAKFRYDVGTVLRPGSVIIVTPEPLGAGSPGREVTVIEDETNPR